MMPLLALAAFCCAWLWWTGIEVPPRPELSGWLWGIGSAALMAAYLKAGERLPWAVLVRRAAGWALVVGLLGAGLAVSLEPAVEWVAPFLSYRTAPAAPMALLARAAGMEAVASGGQLVVQDYVAVPGHALSWQQLEIPAALAMWLMLVIAGSSRVAGRARLALLSAALFAAWTPLRFLLVARAGQDVGWLGLQWHPVTTALSFLPAAWVALSLAPQRSLAPLPLTGWRAVARGLGMAAGVALIVIGLTAYPPAQAAGGRVLMDDAHSDWEWTSIPFDRTHYGRQSTYSYVSLVDLLGHHFSKVDTNMSAELTGNLLAGYDVLILKTPTRAYLESERDAIVQFVENGGGLLLVSDHTNLFGMTTYLNPIGAPFGVQFQTDDTYELVSGQPTRWAPPRLGMHPAVAQMPALSFETSCSLTPAWGLAPVIVGAGLGSEPANYAHVNFFGNISPDPEERWGMFLQAASASRGRGRVLAFTDSTVFSNFSVFFRGTPELALGMISFLNHRSGVMDRVFSWLALPGAGLALASFLMLRRGGRRAGRTSALPLALGMVILGALGGGMLASRINQKACDPPAARTPLTTVAFDSTYSSYRLPTLLEATVPDPQNCFDSFFVATQRLHLFPRVAENLDDAATDARVIVILNPQSWPEDAVLERLYAWVRQGGRLLVMDPGSGAHVAANRFLEAAGMRISAVFPGQADVPALGGLAIYGGQPTRLRPPPTARGTGAPDEKPADPPLIATADVGSGSVVALLGSERVSMQSMGPVFNNPTDAQLKAYQDVYALFENVLLPEGWQKECRIVGRIGAAPTAPAGAQAP